MNPIRLKRPGQPEPLSETAAAWVLRAEEGLSPAEDRELREWLSEPEHERAYDSALWSLDAVQRHSASPELMALRQTALARGPDRTRRAGWAAGIAIFAAAFAAFLVWSSVLMAPVSRPGPSEQQQVAGRADGPARSPGLYRTGIGERSAVVLPDGSLATLDTDTQLRVAYSKAERAVVLVKGQALFEVAKGKELPFQVYAGGQRITAIGTVFNVRLEGDQVQVSMVEGVVRVRPVKASAAGGTPVQELTLRAGESLVTEPAQPVLVKAVDTSQVATWRGGLLVFEDEKLSDAIAEINRYTSRPIELADPSVGEYRVTGVFKTNDPARFASAMGEVFPVTVERRADGSQVLRAQR